MDVYSSDVPDSLIAARNGGFLGFVMTKRVNRSCAGRLAKDSHLVGRAHQKRVCYVEPTGGQNADRGSQDWWH